MHRPLLAAALAVPLALPLVACGGDDDDDTSEVDGGGSDDDGGPDPDAFVADCDPVAGTGIALDLLTDDVDDPIFVTSPPGDPRLFVVERGGLIRIFEDGGFLAAPFLDLGETINDDGGEQGLLGLAFHPDYADNGRFFVFYTAEDDANTIAEYHRSGRDLDLADPAGEIILPIDDIAPNHNGGMMAFGDDGYLYVGTGDGGGGGDPGDNGQDVTELLGKILRIDVDGTTGDLAYAIPADNPLVGSDTEDVRTEIWHVGLRNPWRWSFDRQTDDMWIGDVGQGRWEEVSRIPAGEGGHNLGWSDKEGLECFDEDPCAAPLTDEPAAAFTDPVAVYPNPPGDDEQAAVVGGYVYRGACFPDLVGTYVFADTYSGALSAIDTDDEPLEAVDVDYGDPVAFPVSFGEDAAGELYLVTLGAIYRLRAE